MVLDDSWKDEAVCKGVNQEIFFPARGEAWQGALRYCSICPVQEECLNYALELKIDVGTWGGKSIRERRRIAKSRKAVIRSSPLEGECQDD